MRRASWCWALTSAPTRMRRLHFIPRGKGIDQVPLDVLVGPARVLNFTPCQAAAGD